MNNQHQRISQLESTNSVLYLPRNYEAALTEVTNESLMALRGIDVSGTDFKRSVLSMEDFTHQRAQLIGDIFSDNAKAIGMVIGLVPDILEGIQDFSSGDRAVWTKARQDFSRYSGYGGTSVLVEMIKNASGLTAANAMHAGVDDITYKTGRAWSTFPGDALRGMIKNASGLTAANAMHAGVDDITYDNGRSGYPTPDGALSIMTLFASSPTAANVMRIGVENEPEPREDDSADQKTVDYDELMSILQANEDRSLFPTIQGFEQWEVIKVIATVKSLRENNPTITDRDIALRYAKASNNAEQGTPERQRATQIVMCLMGGKIDGKLPF